MLGHQGTFTPHVMGHWTHYDPQDYSEIGAGGASLTVQQEAVDIAELGIGFDVNWLIPNSDESKFTPEISGGYRYDFIGDRVEATSTFTGGGAAFTSQGIEPARHRYNLGGGIGYTSPKNTLELKAGYNLEFKSGYYAHSGSFRTAFKF